MLFYSFIHIVSPVDSVKVRRTGEVKEKLSVQRTHYIIINILWKTNLF